MQITFVTRKFRNGQQNLHCDVVHITTKWVFRLALNCNGIFAIKAYGRVLRQLVSRRRKDNLSVSASSKNSLRSKKRNLFWSPACSTPALSRQLCLRLRAAIARKRSVIHKKATCFPNAASCSEAQECKGNLWPVLECETGTVFNALLQQCCVSD